MSQQIKNKARYEKILLRLGTLGFSIEDFGWNHDGDTVWFKPTFYVKAPNGNKVECQFKYNTGYDEFFVDGYYYDNMEIVLTDIPTIKTMTDKLATYGFHDLYVEDWNDQNTLLYINDLMMKDACSHDDLQIKTMELSNNELLLTIDCNACGKRISTSAPIESDAWEAEDLNTWAKQELSSHGKNVSFKNWAKKEVKSHGNIDLVDWAKHEKQSHTKKYGAEYENIGTMQSSPASGYNGYMNMMSSARRLVEIGNETGLDQKLGEAYQDESGRWFLPILERKASESFSLDSKKADSINMEEPVIEEPSFIPDGDGRAIGQQNSSINLSPLHAEESWGFVVVNGDGVRTDAFRTKRQAQFYAQKLREEAGKKGLRVVKAKESDDRMNKAQMEMIFDAESRQNSDYKQSYNEDGSLKPYTVIVYRYREGMREYSEQVVVRENLKWLDVQKQVQEMNKEDNGERITEGYVRGYLTDKEYELGLKMNLAAESNLVDINYDAKIRLNNPKDAQYITPSIEEGMAFEEGEGVLSSNAKIDMNAEAIGNEIGCDKCGRFAKLWSYANFDLDLCAICSKKEGFRAEGDSATYSPSSNPDMVNEIQTEPTNATFNAEMEECHTCNENSQIVAHIEDGVYLHKLCKGCYDEHLEMGGEKGVYFAESEAATYSPSSNPDMVNEIQTSPTNESPQLFNASNTFKTTTALGIGGLVVAALSLPMLYSSAKSRLGKSAEEKRKASGSVRKNHTQVKNSEYSVGQVNPVEAEGQQDIHGAEGITNPRHIPSPTPSGYPSKNLKMW